MCSFSKLSFHILQILMTPQNSFHESTELLWAYINSKHVLTGKSSAAGRDIGMPCLSDITVGMLWTWVRVACGLLIRVPVGTGGWQSGGGMLGESACISSGSIYSVSKATNSTKIISQYQTSTCTEKTVLFKSISSMHLLMNSEI